MQLLYVYDLAPRSTRRVLKTERLRCSTRRERLIMIYRLFIILHICKVNGANPIMMATIVITAAACRQMNKASVKRLTLRSIKIDLLTTQMRSWSLDRILILVLYLTCNR